MKPLIGFMGQKRSGKDSAAKVLTDEYGYTRYAFADTMKTAALALDPYIGSKWDGFWHESPVDEKPDIVRLSDLVESEGWEAAKAWPEVRRILQRLGTELGRNLIGENVWVDITMRQVAEADSPSCITDVRFPNEAAAIKSASGILVRVDRPGLTDTDSHSSEHAWRDIVPDVVLLNDRDLPSLHAQVRDLAQSL